MYVDIIVCIWYIVYTLCINGIAERGLACHVNTLYPDDQAHCEEVAVSTVPGEKPHIEITLSRPKGT